MVQSDGFILSQKTSSVWIIIWRRRLKCTFYFPKTIRFKIWFILIPLCPYCLSHVVLCGAHIVISCGLFRPIPICPKPIVFRFASSTRSPCPWIKLSSSFHYLITIATLCAAAAHCKENSFQYPLVSLRQKKENFRKFSYISYVHIIKTYDVINTYYPYQSPST